MYFPTVLKARSSKSRCHQVPFLKRPFLLTGGQWPSHQCSMSSSQWEHREKEFSGVSLSSHKNASSMEPAPSDLSSVQFSSVAQLCLTLCNPMNRSTPGLPVHHQLPEFTQTHTHRVGDAIQPSHPLSSPSPPAPNPSQHQGLFQ